MKGGPAGEEAAGWGGRRWGRCPPPSRLLPHSTGSWRLLGNMTIYWMISAPCEDFFTDDIKVRLSSQPRSIGQRTVAVLPTGSTCVSQHPPPAGVGPQLNSSGSRSSNWEDILPHLRILPGL
uniref:Uncharacterized protein n=1 Tax=Sciurus vulgaris TaxID=55149 RepID=A0A8D2D3H5_SCIVU